MKVYGHLDLLANLIKNGKLEELTEYPNNSKAGMWAFINKSLMFCIDHEDVPLWVPLTQERNTYIFPQDTPSTTWMIEHKFGSENVLIQCFDETNSVVNPTSIRSIDKDISEVVFPDNVSGKAIVMYGYEVGMSATGNPVSGGGGGLGVGHLAEYPNRKAIDEGYIPLDGQRIYRSVYPDLVALLGNEEDEFIDLPDANGRRLFFRGGADDTYVFGDIQEDAIRNITMSVRNAMRSGSGGTSSVTGAGKLGPGGNVRPDHYNGGSYNGFDFDASLQVPTADENRPINTSVVKCIKAFSGKIVGGDADLSQVLNRLNELEAIKFTHGNKYVNIMDERVVGDEYTNNTGKDLTVVIRTTASTNAINKTYVYVDNEIIGADTNQGGNGWATTVSVVVPAGSKYHVEHQGNTLTGWFERTIG